MDARTRTNPAARAVPDQTEPVLTASRALLGVVAQSISPALESVSLPHFRVLVILTSVGPLRMRTLAERMNANISTFSRSIDRMVAGGWVQRTPSPDSRREILISVTQAGRELVDDVTARRRSAIANILARMAPEDQHRVADALTLFAIAAGEPPAADLLILGQ